MNGLEKTHTEMPSGQENKLDHAWKVHDYISTYIQLADTKAGAILVLGTVDATVLAVVPSSLAIWQKCVLGVGLLGLVVGFILALLVIIPRTNHRSNEGLIFWGNIKKYEHYPDYQATFSAMDLLQDVLKHNYYIASIADRKYVLLGRALVGQYLIQPIFWLGFLLAKLF